MRAREDPVRHDRLAGQNFGEDIQIAVIGRASFLEDSILVELRVRRGEITTVEVEVVFLLAMIGKRLARNLPPSDAATVSENSEEQRIHTSALLQIVQDLFGTFVDERNGSHLNADHCFGLAGKCHGRHCQYSAGPRAKPEEFTPFDIGFQHGWSLSKARVDSVRLHRLMQYAKAHLSESSGSRVGRSCVIPEQSPLTHRSHPHSIRVFVI